MARTPDLALKERLLDKVLDYLAVQGLAGASLRPIAADAGVSVNALVHHFGSKEDLVIAALERAITIQDDVLQSWLNRNPRLSQADLLRKWWRWMLLSERNLALVRLGLEAAALDATITGLPGNVRADQIGLWRHDIERRLVAEGVSAETAVVEASLAKAMFTGLVVDLLASGDRRRLGRSLEVGLSRLEQVVWTGAGLSEAHTPASTRQR